MGLFSFPKKVGQKILRRGGDNEQPAAEAPAAEAPAEASVSEAPPVTVDVSAAASSSGDPNADWAMAMQQLREQQAAAAAAAAPAPSSDEGTVVGAGAGRVYVSRAGDTLDAIAAYFYGDPVHRQRLLDENPDLARMGDSLSGGVRLRVPEDAPAPASVTVSDNPAAESDIDYAADPAAASHTAEELTRMAGELGIAVEGLSVSIDGETATVRGVTETQEDKEKIVLFIGNTAGIAQVDDQLEVRQSAQESTFYTVQEGDTLSAIAQAQYGDAGAYPAIFEANRPLLTNPDLIYPGQVLRIPAR